MSVDEAKILLEDMVRDLDDILAYGKAKMSAKQIPLKGIHAKKFYLIHAFAEGHRLAESISATIKINQAGSATILQRSLWELLIGVDFVFLERSKVNLKVLALEGLIGERKAWKQRQELRKNYPKSNTWKIITDKFIADAIVDLDKAIIKTKTSIPSYVPGTFSSLYNKMKEIDDKRIQKNPNHKHLLQFEYRTVYHLFSDNTHVNAAAMLAQSTKTSTGRELLLSHPGTDLIKISGVAYTSYFNLLVMTLKKFGVYDVQEMAVYRAKVREHNMRWKELEAKGQL